MPNLETIHVFRSDHEYNNCIRHLYTIKIVSNSQLVSAAAHDK